MTLQNKNNNKVMGMIHLRSGKLNGIFIKEMFTFVQHLNWPVQELCTNALQAPM